MTDSLDLHGPLLEVFRMQLVDCAPRVATACGEVLYYAWKHTQVAQEREVIILFLRNCQLNHFNITYTIIIHLSLSSIVD